MYQLLLWFAIKYKIWLQVFLIFNSFRLFMEKSSFHYFYFNISLKYSFYPKGGSSLIRWTVSRFFFHKKIKEYIKWKICRKHIFLYSYNDQVQFTVTDILIKNKTKKNVYIKERIYWNWSITYISSLQNLFPSIQTIKNSPISLMKILKILKI